MLQRPPVEAEGIPRAGDIAPRPSSAHLRAGIRCPYSARLSRRTAKRWKDWEYPGSDLSVATVVVGVNPRQAVSTRPIPPTATDHPDRMAAPALLARARLSGTPAGLPDRPA